MNNLYTVHVHVGRKQARVGGEREGGREEKKEEKWQS